VKASSVNRRHSISKGDPRKIAEALSAAAKLKLRPLCVYGSDRPPAEAIPATDISSCLAEAVYALAENKRLSAIYIGGDSIKRCCTGGTTYLGFTEPSPYIKFFVSYGTKEFRNGAAEYLRASPELVEENERRTGKITPPGKYVVISPCSDLGDTAVDVRSLLMFGEPEQIRNLVTLVHFNSVDPFEEVLQPSGPSCASFITYAAGLAEKAPRNVAIVGPFDPTGNRWFPPDMMSLALPIDLAGRMYRDLPESFLVKRSSVAFPSRRKHLKPRK